MIKFKYIWTTFLQSQRGAAIIEFALVSPLFFLALFGVLDYGMQFYGQQVLQGAVSQSARNSTLEGYEGDQTALDNLVTARFRQVFASANMQFSRKAYVGFDGVGKHEPIIGAPSEKRPPVSGECFWDMNGTGRWEIDQSRAGNGGADDVVLYEVTAQFQRMFPFWSLAGHPQETKLRASTVLRNQPYGSQFAVKKICV
jgi:hypothetical protein